MFVKRQNDVFEPQWLTSYWVLQHCSKQVFFVSLNVFYMIAKFYENPDAAVTGLQQKLVMWGHFPPKIHKTPKCIILHIPLGVYAKFREFL